MTDSTHSSGSIASAVAASGRLRGYVGALLGFAGCVLLALNLYGLPKPLRSSTIDSGHEDLSRSGTQSYESAMHALDSLDRADSRRFVDEATKIFYHGMAHIDPKDVQNDGLDHYRMRVPVWENWVLFMLSYVKPDTYRDYEFCSYRKALERGAGRCGQQSMALIGYLAENGLDTGFVHLSGHTLVTARVDDEEWHLLDPDFGAVMPFGIEQAELKPGTVLDYYWSDAARERRLDRLFASLDNEVKYGGPDWRYARACPIERVAYILKWVVPALCLLVAVVLYGRHCRRPRLPT